MKREADEGSCQGKGSSEKNKNEWRNCLRPLAGWRNISWSDDSKAQGETMPQSTRAKAVALREMAYCLLC